MTGWCTVNASPGHVGRDCQHTVNSFRQLDINSRKLLVRKYTCLHFRYCSFSMALDCLGIHAIQLYQQQKGVILRKTKCKCGNVYHNSGPPTLATCNQCHEEIWIQPGYRTGLSIWYRKHKNNICRVSYFGFGVLTLIGLASHLDLVILIAACGIIITLLAEARL